MQGGDSLHAQMAARHDQIEAWNLFGRHACKHVAAQRSDERAGPEILLGVHHRDEADADALQGGPPHRRRVIETDASVAAGLFDGQMAQYVGP